MNCANDLQNCPESSYYKTCNVHSAFLICDSAQNPSPGKIAHNTGIGNRPLSENLYKKMMEENFTEVSITQNEQGCGWFFLEISSTIIFKKHQNRNFPLI